MEHTSVAYNISPQDGHRNCLQYSLVLSVHTSQFEMLFLTRNTQGKIIPAWSAEVELHSF